MRDVVALATTAGIALYVIPFAYRPNGTYIDGSKLGQPLAASVLCNGRIAICRVPRVPNTYIAELVGILIRPHLSRHKRKIVFGLPWRHSLCHNRRPVR